MAGAEVWGSVPSSEDGEQLKVPGGEGWDAKDPRGQIGQGPTVNSLSNYYLGL